MHNSPYPYNYQQYLTIKINKEKKKKRFTLQQEAEWPSPAPQRAQMPHCKYRGRCFRIWPLSVRSHCRKKKKRNKIAFACCCGKYSKCALFKAQNWGRAFLLSFFLYLTAHFACDTCFQICMNMWCSNHNYKIVSSLFLSSMLGDTVKKIILFITTSTTWGKMCTFLTPQR